MAKGVLLVNLGSPDSPSVPDVRRYLREFLMDERVLDVAWPIRFCVVNFAILPSRPKQSARAYQTIWTKEGSPLIAISKGLHAKVSANTQVPVELAMRYQSPSIPQAMRALRKRGVDDLLVIPLFPHFAMSSFETAAERVKEVAAAEAPGMRVSVQQPYFERPEYIRALVESARPYLEKPFDHLLFSFHGIPERHIKKADPTGKHCLQTPNCCEQPSAAFNTCYRAQCLRTMRLFIEKAKPPASKCSLAFQSRLGRDPWLRPYTDHELERLAKDGVRRLLVICPAFVSDCLETLEEIGMRGKETFIEAGGRDYGMIPCLNDHPLWIRALGTFIEEFVESSDGDRTAPASNVGLNAN